jgi:phage gpG-like protein
MVHLKATAKNVDDVVKKLTGVAAVINSPGNILARFAPTMLRSIEQNFQAGGRPRWKPWALSTAWRESHGRRGVVLKSGKVSTSAKRTARARTGKVLIDTARLKNSITARVEGSGPAVLRIGSNVIYARIHQLGGRAGRGHRSLIPARPFLAVQREDLDVLREMIRSAIGEAWR